MYQAEERSESANSLTWLFIIAEPMQYLHFPKIVGVTEVIVCTVKTL